MIQTEIMCATWQRSASWFLRAHFLLGAMGAEMQRTGTYARALPMINQMLHREFACMSVVLAATVHAQVRQATFYWEPAPRTYLDAPTRYASKQVRM
jgi:hypothetical protein